MQTGKKRGEQLRRRNFIVGGIAAAWSARAQAQQHKIASIGFLSVSSSKAFADRAEAFRQGLSEIGFVVDRDVTIEYRWADFKVKQLHALADDLVRRKVNVIAAFGGTSSALAAKAATANIPIVFGAVSEDPVRAGLVASLARPGANITGIVSLGAEIGPKRLELLRELIPKATTIAVLVNETSVARIEVISKSYQSAGGDAGLKIKVVNASSERELNEAFTAVVKQNVGGLVVAPDPLFNSMRAQIAALSVRHAIPTIFQFRDFVAAGGLAAYGAELAVGWRLAGRYAGRILKGEKPSDLPVQQATKLELMLNLKAAKALGIAVPLPLLARADEVIE